MFQKVEKTHYPPNVAPVMVWDGDCSFCKYWITVWRTKTENNLDYVTYQFAADQFPDIPTQHFVEAVRLIEPDGRIYSGPDAAYRGMYYYRRNKITLWHRLYNKKSNL